MRIFSGRRNLGWRSQPQTVIITSQIQDLIEDDFVRKAPLFALSNSASSLQFGGETPHGHPKGLPTSPPPASNYVRACSGITTVIAMNALVMLLVLPQYQPCHYWHCFPTQVLCKRLSPACLPVGSDSSAKSSKRLLSMARRVEFPA